ncbi:hypothetical protein [Epilithonimonas sp. UC225_85]|uniref:hypothetical protein n=1 Tax=Epilithonimonas sp. UC225_85 TaxID=3350167 RepID=UPI0036D2A8AC
MRKLNLLYILVFVLLSSGMLFSQTADRLYLSLESTGRIYDITALSATPATAIALPTPVTGSPNFSTTSADRASNIAVGYDVPGGNSANLVYINSDNAAGSSLYKNGTIINGVTLPVQIGGYATNNVPGPYFGNVYGFSSGSKILYPVYPAGPAVTITGDTEWTNGTTVGTDTFFDYQNNIYMFIDNTVAGTTTRYLYKISIATGVATKAVTISGVAASVTSIQGMAYLQGYVYIATSVNPNTITVRRINIFDGTSSLVATYTGGGFLNLDLGTVPYYVPFQFTCGNITQTSSVPFVAGVASGNATGTAPNQKFINIPISNVYGPGTYIVNVTGTDFTNPAYSVNVTAATTSIQVPLIYNGTGAGGTRTLTVNLNGSTTACTVNVLVDSDTDGDTIGNSQDLDSDNDGILDIFECPDSVVDVNFSSTDGTVTNFSAPAADLGFIFDVYTLDNSFNLNINGTNLSTTKLEFQPDQTDNVRFLDGATYGSGSVPQIYQMTGSAAAPLVRIIIHKNGAVNMYGSKVGGGPLSPLQLYNGNAFNNIVWNQTGANTIQLTQAVVGATYITGRGNGVKNGVCDPDGDGLSNQFDVDSDGDGCPDSIEGSETVKFDQVHSLSLVSTDTNYAYRGQIKVLANGTATGTPIQVVSKIAGANGVPELVNYAVMNTSGTAGVADNTDGTSDVGQGIGDSQNASVNSCICYKPVVTAGTALDTNQGITSLQRAGTIGSNWPMVRKGAWTALEAKTKGFVPNRLTTAQITAIPAASLIEGMMVYNTTLDCLQINTDGTAAGWKCFNNQTCSDVN